MTKQIIVAGLRWLGLLEHARKLKSRTSKTVNPRDINRQNLETIARLEAKITRQMEFIESQRVRIKEHRARTTAARERVKQLKLHKDEVRHRLFERVENNRTLKGRIREIYPVPKYLDYAHHAVDVVLSPPEVCIGHGVEAMPAAVEVARKFGARCYCDCIEIPSFFDRAVRWRWSDTTTRFLDYALEGYLKRCDGIITVGWTLGKELEQYGPPVHVVPNFRCAETVTPSNVLRTECGLEEDEILLIALGTITSQLEVVLQALKLLPDHVHLVTVGRLVPEDYADRCREVIKKHNLQKRVHLRTQIPYEQLTATTAGTDIGLIVLNPSVPNHRVALPNRIFDYIFSGIPVVGPYIADIAKIVHHHDIGVTIDALSPESWAAGISQVIDRRKELKQNALLASKELTWETLEDHFFESLGKPKSVVFFGIADLDKNNRTQRMIAALWRKGAEVQILRPK